MEQKIQLVVRPASEINQDPVIIVCKLRYNSADLVCSAVNLNTVHILTAP